MPGLNSAWSGLLDTSGHSRPTEADPAIDREQRRAARVIAVRATDLAEAGELLAMLGLDHLPALAGPPGPDPVPGPIEPSGATGG